MTIHTITKHTHRNRVDRAALSARHGAALALVTDAHRAADLALLNWSPGTVDTAAVVGQLVEEALTGGPAPSVARATTIATDLVRAGRSDLATGVALVTGHKRQAVHTRRPVRRSVALVSARQIGRLIAPGRRAALAVPVGGPGRPALALALAAPVGGPVARRALADLVRHQSALAGRWAAPVAPALAGRLRDQEAVWRPGLPRPVGGPVSVAPVCGPASALAAVVCGVLSDGPMTQTDRDAGRLWADRAGVSGVARQGRERHTAVPVSPRSTDGLPVTAADLARHQLTVNDRAAGPVRLVREGSLRRMLDKRNLTAGKPVDQEATGPAGGGLAAVETGIWWAGFLNWSPAPGHRGATARVIAAVSALPDQWHPPMALAPRTIGSVTAEAVRQANGAPWVNWSAACRSVGLPVTGAHRAALADLARAAVRAADLAADLAPVAPVAAVAVPVARGLAADVYRLSAPVPGRGRQFRALARTGPAGPALAPAPAPTVRPAAPVARRALAPADLVVTGRPVIWHPPMV